MTPPDRLDATSPRQADELPHAPTGHPAEEAPESVPYMQINFKKMTISHTLYRKTWNTWSDSSAQLPGAVVLPGQREHGPHHTQKQRVLVTNKHFAGASHAQSACSVLPPHPGSRGQQCISSSRVHPKHTNTKRCPVQPLLQIT